MLAVKIMNTGGGISKKFLGELQLTLLKIKANTQ